MQMFIQLLALCVAAHAVCNQPRTRKPFEAMTAIERWTYLYAVELAMDRGYHAHFAEIHSQAESFSQAHGGCGFLMWHRRYLLAYENMLRSFGETFECITIPYWNYFADYAKFQNQQCNSLESCSEILQFLGGSSGQQDTVQIDGRSVSGRCNQERPNNNFCESSQAETCKGCLPRGNWAESEFPSGLGYASLTNLLHASTNYSALSTSVERSFHNSIHNVAGSTMATSVSPADVIFWSHHATIDMVHHVFYECHVGRTMNESEKMTSDLAFGQCDGLDAESEIIMLWENENGTGIPAHEHAVLEPFFRDTGSQYMHFVDSLDMGNHSYGYEVDELIHELTENGLTCPQGRPDRTLRRLETTSDTDDSSNDQDAEEAETKVISWYDAAHKEIEDAGHSEEETYMILVCLECRYHEYHLGGVENFSPEFREEFGVDYSTECWDLLHGDSNQECQGHLAEWDHIIEDAYANNQ